MLEVLGSSFQLSQNILTLSRVLKTVPLHVAQHNTIEYFGIGRQFGFRYFKSVRYITVLLIIYTKNGTFQLIYLNTRTMKAQAMGRPLCQLCWKTTDQETVAHVHDAAC